MHGQHQKKIKQHSKITFLEKNRESIQLINFARDVARYLADCNVTYFHFLECELDNSIVT